MLPVKKKHIFEISASKAYKHHLECSIKDLSSFKMKNLVSQNNFSIFSVLLLFVGSKNRIFGLVVIIFFHLCRFSIFTAVGAETYKIALRLKFIRKDSLYSNLVLLFICCMWVFHRYIMSQDRPILRRNELDSFLCQAFNPNLMNVQHLQELTVSDCFGFETRPFSLMFVFKFVPAELCIKPRCSASCALYERSRYGHIG